jgi:hypothetical protein
MNIVKPLLGSICLEYHDEEWTHTIDYKHIPFRCRKCHEHGHLFQDCPLNAPPKIESSHGDRDKEGFTQARSKRRHGQKKPTTSSSKAPCTSNSFEILNHVPEDLVSDRTKANLGTGSLKGKSTSISESIIEKISPNHVTNPTGEDLGADEVGDMEIELDEKDLAEIDQVSLEEAYHRKDLSSIPPYQLRKVHKFYLNSIVGATSRSGMSLSIHHNPTKDPRKILKKDKRRG